MRIALLSDIHSNLTALEAVLEDAKNRSIDKFYCLGDIVGYAAHPLECVKIIRKICEKVVFGNHEYAILYPEYSRSFNEAAQQAIEYSRKCLDSDAIEWLKTLEPHMILPEITLAHGSLRDFEEYVTDVPIARMSLEIQQTMLLVVGHTHYPEGYVYDIETRTARMLDIFGEGEIILEDDKRYLMNVGSIGQPRDGDPRAAYAIFDTESKKFELIRVKYDIDKAANAILNVHLPAYLAKRLYAGR